MSVVNQFIHAPTTVHLDAVYRILRYLKTSPDIGLLNSRRSRLCVEGYTDADWAGCANDRRSTSCYCTFVGGNLVTWHSKKQTVMARSSTEAEFCSMAHGVYELLCLRLLLSELGFPITASMCLYCDNKAIISIAHNPVQYDIEVNHHFIKKKLLAGLISTPFVKIEDQLADLFTKGLSRPRFHSLVRKLGVFAIYHLA